MKIYDELVARGLIAQVTDEDEIKELIKPFFGAFDRKYLNFKLLCIII